jgi:GntP family gluconate:H+ symporter
MAIAAGIALLAVAARAGGKDGVAKGVGEALASAGVIILITSAGGAFGQVLQQTDIAATIKDLVPAGRLALLPLVFLVTMTIRIAQGSATVAMVTAAGIASPLAAAGGLGFHPVYLALAIGCGSKPGMWMNDSGFWIIGRMSGFTEGETLRTATVMMSIMGLAGGAAVMLLAWLVPMV